MTEENYNYRTSQTLLRNQFPGKGKLQIPIIPRFKAKEDDLKLIPVMDATVNEQIKAQFENVEKTGNNSNSLFKDSEDNSDYMV